MLFSRGQKVKNITNIELERLYAVSRAKTDLNSKYIFNFVFGLFLELDHLLNLFF